VVEHLLRKYKGPSSNPNTMKKKEYNKVTQIEHITFGISENTFTGSPTTNYIHESRVQERGVS
jgi:hypothetical protein